MAEETKLQDMIRTSLESIRAMVDANTVVGTPITTPAGTTVIPISKVAVGYASGGYDASRPEDKKHFAGGGGTGLSVQPVCFLAVHADGTVEMIPLGSTGALDPIDKAANLLERAPDLIERIKAIFKRKSKRSDAEADEDMTPEEAIATVTEAAIEAVEDVAAAKKAE